MTEESAPVFAALGDETRLRVLESAGLVRGSRLGRERVWELEPKQLEEARRYLDLISQQWDEVLDRLKATVER